MAHTPGPWVADGHHVRTSESGIGAPYIVAKGRNAKANACLIAAAPDLLQALQFLLCIDFDRFTDHDEALLESALADARTAIAKAESR